MRDYCIQPSRSSDNCCSMLIIVSMCALCNMLRLYKVVRRSSTLCTTLTLKPVVVKLESCQMTAIVDQVD